MKKIIRYAILTALVMIAFVGLFSQPTSEFYSSAWAIQMLVSKALGVCAGLFAYVLACNWSNKELL